MLNTYYNVLGPEEVRHVLKKAIKNALDKSTAHVTTLEIKFRELSRSKNNRIILMKSCLKGMQLLVDRMDKEIFSS